MKKMKFVSLFFAALLACTSAQAATVMAVVSGPTVQIGGTFSVELWVSELGAGVAPSLGNYSIDYGFEPALMLLDSVVFGTGLDLTGLGSLQNAIAGVGTVNLSEFSFDSVSDIDTLQPASFRLATLNFLGVGAGNAVFSFQSLTLNDANGSSLSAMMGDAGQVLVTAVPEPATLPLAALALSGLLMAARRRRLSLPSSV